MANQPARPSDLGYPMIRPLPLLLLIGGLVAADWRPTAPMQAAALHARGDTVAAWSAASLWMSTDAGRSWAGPVAPTIDGRSVGVSRAVVAVDGVYVLGADGSLWMAAAAGWISTGRHAVDLVVDGGGVAWVQQLDGGVVPLPAGQPRVAGTVAMPVRAGVVVQRGMAYVLATTTGEQQLRAPSADGPPAAAHLVRPSTGAGEAWLTGDGVLWKIYDSTVQEASRRPVAVLSTWWSADGMHECVRYQGRPVLYRPGPGGRQIDVRTDQMPAATVAVAATSHGLVAIDGTQVWVETATP